ncbi:MAG: DUF2188 domain-containing protein [Bacilli bacterium]
MPSKKQVICRPCKEEGGWEVKTPSGKVLPNKFNSKADSIRVGKKYAMEAGAELIVVEQEANNQNKKSSK